MGGDRKKRAGEGRERLSLAQSELPSGGRDRRRGGVFFSTHPYAPPLRRGTSRSKLQFPKPDDKP